LPDRDPPGGRRAGRAQPARGAQPGGAPLRQPAVGPLLRRRPLRQPGRHRRRPLDTRREPLADVALIPIHDANPLRHIRYPYVTWLLLAANAAVFFFVEAGWTGRADKIPAVEFGLIPAVFNGLAERPGELAIVPSGLTLLTYAFFHGDFWHLAGNMIF